MKLLVLSDLHVEFSEFTPDPGVVSAADVVVLAGDIHVGTKAVTWARKTFGDKPIVLVAGNHELYHGHWERTMDAMREEALIRQVHFLENESVIVNGVQFLGSTLWTDFAYFGDDQIMQAMNESRRFMADYRLIKDCSPDKTLARHQASRQWLEQQLASPADAIARVVVTHHYPHKKSTAQRYKSDLCTAEFGSQLPDEMFERAGLWIHGHTHDSCMYDVNGCLVVCNPRGYPRGLMSTRYENSNFDPGLLLEHDAGGKWRVVSD